MNSKNKFAIENLTTNLMHGISVRRSMTARATRSQSRETLVFLAKSEREDLRALVIAIRALSR